VIDPAGVYQPTDLECTGGSQAYGRSYQPVAPDADGPVAVVSRVLDGVRTDDDLVTVGYAHSDPRLIGVNRNGALVAVVSVASFKGGWIFTGFSACSDSGLRVLSTS
jgi:hypothetical protein